MTTTHRHLDGSVCEGPGTSTAAGVCVDQDPDRTSAPQDLADQMLEAVARAERAEASLDLTQDDLRLARVERDEANARSKRHQQVIDELVELHTAWGDTEGAGAQQQWEQMGRILGVTA